ncbi:MAG: nitroreductase family protein [Methanoregulaceae archaeon]
MNDLSEDQRNAILDEIISERRTHRRFKEEIPSDDAITRIIHAGLHAPFAGAAVAGEKEYFRRFFVIRKNSETMKSLQPLFFGEVAKMASALDQAVAKDAQLRARAAGFVSRLAMIRKMGFVPGVGTAPFYVVIAEKKGFPPVEQESLAHCLENMWLKATALGLGFQLVSSTSMMADNEEFCRILGLRVGTWGFMGCAIGYPVETLSPSIRPSASEVTAWLP